MRTKSSPFTLHLFLILAFMSVPVATHAETVTFHDRGTYRTARFQQMSVSVTPEVNLPLLGLLDLNGLGVVGGSSDTTLDPGESFFFQFSTPATAVSYFVGLGVNGDGDNQIAEASVEGYGADGTLLGVAAVASIGLKDVSALFGNAPLSAFRVHTRDNDRQRIAAVSFDPLLGATKIGVYRNGTWYLDTNGNGVWDAATDGKIVGWGGDPSGTPVVGQW